MKHSLTLRQPDDFHVHFRDGEALTQTVPEIAAVFRRAVAMPNLVPPVRTAVEALGYADRLKQAALAAGYADFVPLPSIYLTDTTPPDDIIAAHAAGLLAAKLYPLGATTHSDAGVRDPLAIDPILAAMADCGLVLQVHGETTTAGVDVFDREEDFITRVLMPIRQRFPKLRIVFEHITTRAAVDIVTAADPMFLAATITPQHLAYDRNAMFAGGLRPHLYCLPVPKTATDTRALVGAALSGKPHFFLGSDSAPHPRHRKENACCAAGVYSGPTVLSLYAETFEKADALDRLEAFASRFGAEFYGLPLNPQHVELQRNPWRVPDSVPLGDSEAVPYRAGEMLAWRVSGIG